MEIDGCTHLIFDKYDSVSQNNYYNNVNTMKITLEFLFSDKSYDYKQYYYNNDNNNDDDDEKYYHPNDDIPKNLNKKLYTIIQFVSPNESVYTVLSVNSDIYKYDKIPHNDFLKIACRYHICYTKIERGSLNILDKDIISNNITNIIESVISKTGDVTDPIMANPSCLNYKLYEYQNRSVKWMVDFEKNIKKHYYNLNDEIILGDFYYDSIQQILIPNKNKNKLIFTGGSLIDEVGLGKTIQMMALSLLNESNNISYTRENSNKLYSRATLVIAPNHICPQWSREIIDKVKKDLNINVIMILTKTHFKKYTYQDLLDADFVIVSFNFFENKAFLESWLDKIMTIKNYHKRIPDLFDKDKISSELDKISLDIINNPIKLVDKEAIIPAIFWHRIVIDEFHELCTVPSYNYITNLLSVFQSTYKWTLTGTPFNKKSNCLQAMLDFSTNYENPFKDSIFKDHSIKNFMTKNFFRRNTKKSTEDEYKLPPYEEINELLTFSHTERTMYNAFLANKLNDPQSVYLRKICCHPKLADEIKDLISNCKTLEEINDVMIKHHEKDMNDAEENLKEGQLKVVKLTKKLNTYILLRKKKLLALKDYEGVFENKIEDLSDDDDDDKENNRIYSNGKIIINKDNDKRIMDIIGKRWDEQRITFDNKINSVKNAEDNVVKLKKEYDGKKTTFEYYKNAVNQIRKICNNDAVGDDEETCCICLGEITSENIGVTMCGHRFCYQCIKEHLAVKNTCPYCRKKIDDKSLFMISLPKEEKKNSNAEIADKMQLINEVGTKLANLIFYLKKNNKHTIIFSQWDDLLHKVGDVLNNYNIKNVFCRGNVWTRDKAIRTFNDTENEDVKVIMLSSESAASGTNLTKASQVIILDPIIGTYEFRRNMEWQAIGRAYRMGQKNKVSIVRFIIKDTIEEEIYKKNKLEDSKYKKDIVIHEKEIKDN